MDEIEPDLLIYCVALAGEDSANVCAHVCRAWRDAARAVWGRWRSGAWAVTSSVERYRWAESIGCPWRGRTLMRAAARVGAVDLLSVVAPLYREWDDGATYEAAVADHVEIIRMIDRVDPALVYGAGPRVRAHLEAGGSESQTYEFLDPSRDFRVMLYGAVAINPSVPSGGWTRHTVAELGTSLGPDSPTVTVQVSVELAASDWRPTMCRFANINLGLTTCEPDRNPIIGPDWGRMVRVRVPDTWSIIYDVQPSVGRIRYIQMFDGDCYDFDPRRKWFRAGAQTQVWSLIIDVGHSVTTTVALSYTAALVPRPAREFIHSLWDDDAFSYTCYICHPRSWRLQTSRWTPLPRVDGEQEDQILLAGTASPSRCPVFRTSK